jgi:hypothetical protein
LGYGALSCCAFLFEISGRLGSSISWRKAQDDLELVPTLWAITLKPANIERLYGGAKILHRLGEPRCGGLSRLFTPEQCGKLVATLPALQHDPNRPEDMLKVDCEGGCG